MNLYDAIKNNLGDEPNAPCIGVNGYGGEMDGSHTVFSEVYTTRKIVPLKNTIVPKGWRLNWAKKEHCYSEGTYYVFVLYSWSDWDRESLVELNKELRKLGVDIGF